MSLLISDNSFVLIFIKRKIEISLFVWFTAKDNIKANRKFVEIREIRGSTLLNKIILWILFVGE